MSILATGKSISATGDSMLYMECQACGARDPVPPPKSVQAVRYCLAEASVSRCEVCCRCSVCIHRVTLKRAIALFKYSSVEHFRRLCDDERDVLGWD